MAGRKTQDKKRLSVIVESTLSGCIKRANEDEVTGEEFQGIYSINNSFVLVYYR